jgi:HEAT repeat protein
MRRIGAEMLGYIKDPNAFDDLLLLLNNEKDPEVIQAAVDAIKRILNPTRPTAEIKIFPPPSDPTISPNPVSSNNSIKKAA